MYPGKQARTTNLAEETPSCKSEPAQPTQHKAVPESSHSQYQEPPAADPYAEDTQRQKKRYDDEKLAKLVAEENASKSKFPRYPGLERWELVDKMGDGAFSNVYRARDLTGEQGEVAIKVVRKYEMNSMQVSSPRVVCICATPSP